LIIIWAPYDSVTANRLANELKCIRIKHKTTKPPPGFLVNWGSTSCPKNAGLNPNAPLGNKLLELTKLSSSHVPVPPYMHGLPGMTGWLGRSLHHVNGDDLDHCSYADFWTKIVKCSREFRVHSFRGKSIILGERKPTTPNHHPFIRTTDKGWDISYPSMKPGQDPIGGSLRIALRSLAAQAVKAVGYDFGAVDIGLKEDGGLVVFEVNSAPGLDPGLELNRYCDAIIDASKGE